MRYQQGLRPSLGLSLSLWRFLITVPIWAARGVRRPTVARDLRLALARGVFTSGLMSPGCAGFSVIFTCIYNHFTLRAAECAVGTVKVPARSWSYFTGMELFDFRHLCPKRHGLATSLDVQGPHSANRKGDGKNEEISPDGDRSRRVGLGTGHGCRPPGQACAGLPGAAAGGGGL